MLDDAPLPTRYDVDECVAIPVDPSTLYVYWEVRERTLEYVRAARPGGALALRIVVIVPTWTARARASAITTCTSPSGTTSRRPPRGVRRAGRDRLPPRGRLRAHRPLPRARHAARRAVPAGRGHPRALDAPGNRPASRTTTGTPPRLSGRSSECGARRPPTSRARGPTRPGRRRSVRASAGAARRVAAPDASVIDIAGVAAPRASDVDVICPMTRPRRRRTADAARREILEAAERRLAQSGPAGLRLQDVAADVGISHPAVLHHFGSREGLVHAVIQQAIVGLQEDLVRSLSETQQGEAPDAAALFEHVFRPLSTEGHAARWPGSCSSATTRSNEKARANWEQIGRSHARAPSQAREGQAKAHLRGHALRVIRARSALVLFGQADRRRGQPSDGSRALRRRPGASRVDRFSRAGPPRSSSKHMDS